jgi:hypothetical protein
MGECRANLRKKGKPEFTSPLAESVYRRLGLARSLVRRSLVELVASWRDKFNVGWSSCSLTSRYVM